MSRSSFIKSVLISSFVLGIQPISARARDASFACKVLLCGASTNPSWPSIPYCVPIMQQAIAMQAVGIAVGVCVEAMTGGQRGNGGNSQQNSGFSLPSNGLTSTKDAAGGGSASGSSSVYPQQPAQ